MTDFADRYDDEIARGMLDAGSAAGGLPGYLGIEHVRFEPGRFFATATIAPELLTPFGNAHGGVTAAIVDHVTGVVVYPLMQRGQWAATTVNYLAPLKAETVDAEATVVAMTKRSAVVRCELYRQDDDRRILAAAQATLTIVDPR
jgi:1,4-dihydroxy-2-naphthoyl-CoA hydrolase